MFKIFSLFKRNDESQVDTEINKIIQDFEKYFIKIDNLLPSYKDVAYKLFYDVIRRFIRKVYDAPASENHHHSEPFGLLKHSLETVINSLVEQHKYLELKYDQRGNIDSQFNLKNKEKVLYRTAINALFHDAGKLFDFIIKDESGAIFDPFEDNLLDFKLKYPKCELMWKPNRTKKHEKRNIILLFDILTQQDRQYLSAINFLRLIDDFFGYDPKSTIQEIIREADVKSVIAERKEDKNEEKGIKEDIALVEYFIKSVNDLANQQSLLINKIGGQIFVLDTVSLLVTPLVVNKAINYMQKNYRYKTTANHLISILSQKDVIISDNAGKNFFKGTLVFNNGREVTLNFVIIKNKFLWGCSKPDNFQGKVKFDDFVTSEIQSIDDEPSENDNTLMHKQEQTQDQCSKEHEKVNEAQKIKKKKRKPLYEKFIEALIEVLKDYSIDDEPDKPIFQTTVSGQEYIVVKWIDGFNFIAQKTNLYDLENARKEADRICDSLNNSNYVFKMDNNCLVTIKLDNETVKGILIYKNIILEKTTKLKT
ncbi:TraI domain-containing protein [Deferribacter abyssi]|uniref:TraI domain-containing protein n=1 Tax=Deferribacter abyssi TaxID=213806 RepID=UPI003C2A0AB3